MPRGWNVNWSWRNVVSVTPSEKAAVIVSSNEIRVARYVYSVLAVHVQAV